MPKKATASKISISVTMIVKNEEMLLERAIKSAQNVMGVSDIVIADTGSTDKTKQIANACGARVFDFKWVDDFAAARNFAAEQAINDWIFFLDADEEVIEADAQKTIELMESDNCVGIASMIELSDSTIHGATRLYNRRAHTLTGSIHENITPITEVNAASTADAGEQTDGQTDEQIPVVSKRVKIPISLSHRGYLPEIQQEKGKYERNVSMLERELQKNPDDPYYLYQLGKCCFNFGRDLEKACECFEKALSKCDDIHLEYIYSTVECYGYALINTAKYREALNLLDVYFEHYKNNPNFRFLAGHIFQNNGMFVEAVECFESCIGAVMIDPKGISSYLSYYNIGVILECIEMTDDAIEMYKCCGDYKPALARLAELEPKNE